MSGDVDAAHSTPSTMYDSKRFIERGSHKGKGLAVFTSGGDSQGTAWHSDWMNLNFYLQSNLKVLLEIVKASSYGKYSQ